jgi:hypothetical protein
MNRLWFIDAIDRVGNRNNPSGRMALRYGNTGH